jgi:AcrR family transcriptional regulator
MSAALPAQARHVRCFVLAWLESRAACCHSFSMSEVATTSVQERRKAQQERQRRRLILAAGETFVALGYATSTVADILKAAGMSRRSFYEFFTSKEDILLALLDEMVAEIRAEVSELTRGVENPFERATLMMLAYVRVAARFPVVSYQVMAAGGEPRVRRRQHLASFLEQLNEQLRAAHEAGLISRSPDDVTLRMLVGGLDHLILSYHLDGTRERLGETEGQVRELFSRAFK